MLGAWSPVCVPDARPFNIVVLADFAAAESRRAAATEVDVDNCESYLAGFMPHLEIGLPFCGALDLSSAGQLHPDALCALVHGLSALLEARAEAHDPRRMEDLATEAGAVVALDPAPPPARSRRERSGDSDRALLDGLLGGARRSDTDPVRRLARSLGEAASESGDHAATERRRAALDAELTARLRALLQVHEVRRLEALCLGLRALVRAAPDPERVRIRAVHAPLDALEIAAPLLAGASLLIAAHGFDGDEAGLARLRALARLAEGLGVSALAAATPGTLAAGGFRAGDLEMLRTVGAARHVGFCHPRVLARLPYGAETEPIESFRFEELAGEPDDDDFVWCDGALAAARALARCVTETGDTRALSRFLTLDGLPFYAGSATTGRAQRGPTDESISEREAEALVARGVNPLVAMRGSDCARFAALRALDGGSLFER